MSKKHKNCCRFAFGVMAVTALWTVSGNHAYCDSAKVDVPTSLTKMEDRLLEHDYHKETVDVRLNRLETFVFGAPESGSPEVRVERLRLAIVPAPESEATAQPPTSTKQPVATAPKSPAVPSSQKPYEASDFGSYPRVAELEQQLFGKTFESEPLPVRVSRLETKEFGKPSKEDDLCDRIDKLDEIALKTDPTGKSGDDSQLGRAHSAYQPTINPWTGSSVPEIASKPTVENPFAPGSTQGSGVEQRTTTLEKMVFGHEHFGKSLTERVQRLEKKLVPYEHQADKDLATRIDHLWTMLSAANSSNSSPISTD